VFGTWHLLKELIQAIFPAYYYTLFIIGFELYLSSIDLVESGVEDRWSWSSEGVPAIASSTKGYRLFHRTVCGSQTSVNGRFT
jgi:hypothetical protein